MRDYHVVHHTASDGRELWEVRSPSGELFAGPFLVPVEIVEAPTWARSKREIRVDGDPDMGYIIPNPD